MHVQLILLLFILSAILNLSLAGYGWIHRRLPGAMAFSIAMILFTLLPLTQAVNEFSGDFSIKVMALKTRADTAGIGATAWAIMMMQLTGHSRLVNRRFLIMAAIAPLVVSVLNWTENPVFRSGYFLDELGVLHWSVGPVFWFALLYLNLLLLAPLYLLWNSYGNASPLSLKQTLALSLSAILPILINLLVQLNIISLPLINFPFAAGPLMGSIVAWAVLRYHLFDVIPFARGLLIENMSDGVLVLDARNRIVDVNPAMRNLIRNIKPGQSAESAFSAWPDLLSRFRDIQQVRTEISLDGDAPGYFDLRISPLYDSAHRLTGRLIVVRDITQHKQTEVALRKSEDNFRRMLESAPDAMVIVNTKGIITLANEQCEKVFGYQKAELVGHSVDMLLPERFRQVHERYRTDFYRTPQVRPMGLDLNWQLMARRKDGTEFPVEISLSPLETERELSVTAAVRDITARKEIEKTMELQVTALRAAANAIAITDPRGVIQWVNPAFTMLTGYEESEAVGQSMLILRSHRHSETFYRELWGTIQAGLVWEDEIINRRKDGREYVEHQTITPVKDERGNISHYVAIKQDITARRKMEEALSEAESRYRTLVEQIPAVVYVDELDEANSATYVSPQIEALLGYPYSIWQADSSFWKRCVHPEDYERAIAVTPKTLQREHVMEEYRMVGQDGQIIWVRDHSILVHDSEGNPRFVQGFWQDITEQRLAEENLHRQNNYLEALHQITLDLFNRRGVDQVLQGIVERAAEFLNIPFCEIMLAEHDELVVSAFTRNQPFLAGDRIKRGEARLSWQAFDSRQMVVVNDYVHWPHRRALYDELNLSAVVALPILVGDRCIGVLDLSKAKEGSVFDDSEIRAARLFAQLAALVLDNTQLYSDAQHEIEERRRTEETLRTQNEYLSALHEVTLGLINHLEPDAVLQGILMHVTSLMKTEHALVQTVDPMENVLIQKVAVGNYISQIGFRVKKGEGLTGRVWQDKKMLVVPDYSQWENRLTEFNWLRSVAGVPMQINGNVIGVIGVAFDEPNRTFTGEETELLQRFANLAAIVLDNAQMVSAAVRQSQELSLLHEVRTAITLEMDLTRIVSRTVEAIARTFGYTLVSLYLLKDDMLILQHQVGYENVISKIPITEGVTGYVARTGKPVFLEDVHENPTFLEAVEGIVSEVAVPLIDEGKPVGVLNIESQHGVKMTMADLHLMIALSDQIGIAISRARVYSALRRKNERLSILHEAALDLLNKHQLDELPQTITDHIVRLLDSGVGYLSLREGDDLIDRAITPPDFPYSMATSKFSEDISPVKQVYESGKPFVTENFSALPNILPETAALGARAMLLLPILYGNFCQGVVGAARFVNSYPFDEDDINFGNLYSRLAAIALDNAQLHEALRQDSIRDPLTSLFNRRFMQEALLQELRRAERTSRPLTIVMLDLDHFKSLNDTHGHDAGDEALRHLGLLLKTRIRGSDIACRYGGEEFILILPEASVAAAVARMEELRQDIKQLVIRHDGRNISRLSGSFGISSFPQHGTTPEQLLKAADEALYRAKQAGRDRVIAA